MAEKRLLIADADASAWNVFRNALGEGWTVVGTDSCHAALAESETHPFDAIVANAALPDLGGAELLNRLRQINPKIRRYIAAGVDLKEKFMSNLLGGDQFLAVPYDPATLKHSIEREFTADYGMNSAVRELVARIRTFPTIPSLYVEVSNALHDPNATTADIGAIIAKDLSMTTKLVQVINSAYLGLRRSITDPTEAVGLLGFETVKSLIMTVKLLSQYDKVKPVYFSIDSIWRHSTNVARTAKTMATLETNDPDCAGAAYTAGLMHDLGKVILAANFDDQYHRAHTMARKEKLPLWQMEKEVFGATHGEIGAYLLALWGMTDEVVKVTAFHHEPLRSGDKTFTALTAVHVANVLEHEKVADPSGLLAPVVDCDYLQSLDMADRVELWRFARREGNTNRKDAKAPPGKIEARPAAQTASASVAETVQTEQMEPARPRPNFAAFWKWLGLGLGIGTLAAWSVWLETDKAPEVATVPAVVNQDPAPAPASAPDPAPAPAPAPSAQLAILAADPAPEPTTPALAAPLVKTASPSEKTGIDKLNLQAIFFSAQHPTALINGHLTSVDQDIADCRVLDITPSSVTLEYQHQRKTLKLP